MFTLYNLCLSALSAWVMEHHEEDVDRVVYRLRALLMENLPNSLKFDLIPTVLQKLYLIMSSQQHRESYTSEEKQRELIPLIKTCVKTSKVLCMDSRFGMEYFVNNKCMKAMSDVIEKLNDNIRDDLFNAVCEDEETKLKILHYHSYDLPMPTLHDIIERSQDTLVSLKLSCYNFIMPECRCGNLTELYLEDVRYYHPPTVLTTMTSLTTLYLDEVSGIPNNVYKQFTCRLIMPHLENIYINYKGGQGYEALEFTVNNYICSCIEPCIYNLTWIGQVCLSRNQGVTRLMLRCLKVNRAAYDYIIIDMRGRTPGFNECYPDLFSKILSFSIPFLVC